MENTKQLFEKWRSLGQAKRDTEREVEKLEAYETPKQKQVDVSASQVDRILAGMARKTELADSLETVTKEKQACEKELIERINKLNTKNIIIESDDPNIASSSIFIKDDGTLGTIGRL